MTTKRFYRRRFLNRRGLHAGAYVLADCRIDAFRPKGGRPNYTVDAVVTIADCNRIASLDFSVHDELSAHNALYKARLLRDVLIDFSEALESSLDEWRDLRESARTR